MPELNDLERNWEIYGRTDPMWGVLMARGKRAGNWEPGEFFASGRSEIATVLAHLGRLGLAIDFSGEALDFGCGVGRLSQALADRFEAVCGVDISAAMIRRAIELNQCPERCRYMINAEPRLAGFDDERFSFVYSSIVLQHMDPQFALGYLREFGRVLRPGGTLVFQIPNRLRFGASPLERVRFGAQHLRRVVGARTRARRLLRRIGLVRSPPNTGEAAAEMHCIDERRISSALQAVGLEIVDIQLTNSTDPDFVGQLRYLDAEPTVGYVSRQYCAIKPP